jgi:hypothetical protein
MSSGFASLHKILKDSTRQRIIILINENGSLSYTDLIEKLEVVSTGLLNYHLKVLGDLLSKNEEGHYSLSEKGKLASKLLEEFPEQESQQLRKKRKKFWSILALSQIIYLSVTFALYVLKYIDFGVLVICTITFVGMIPIIYMGYRQYNRPPQKNFKLFYVGFGGVAGLAFALFGTPLLSFISFSLGGPNILQMTGSSAVYFLSFLAIAAILGCITGYFIGKKRSFKEPTWGNKWFENI